MEELIKWLQDVGPDVGTYPDDLYKTGVELCERHSKNRAIKATFRVMRPTPLHKKLLRNTLKSTADLLERQLETGKKKADTRPVDKLLPPPKKTRAAGEASKKPTKKKAPKSKAKAGTSKPSPRGKNAKATRK